MSRADLRRWAADTWRSLDAMTAPGTGLPADHLAASLAPATRSRYTSPTIIGGLLWSTVAARELGLIGADEAVRRCRAVIDNLAGMRVHHPSGMLYNWYDEATGQRLDVLPDGGVVNQFLSSVDNGWLGAALLVVRNAVPEMASDGERLLARMDFGCFYDPAARLLYGGLWAPDDASATPTGHHYGHLMSEPRIASYVGIARGQIPPENTARCRGSGASTTTGR